MTDNKVTVSYIAFEGEMTRLERINKRLWITSLILTGVLILTNVSWILYTRG